jgi:hypothetical protein
MSSPPAPGGALELRGFNVAQREEAAMSRHPAIDLHSSNSVLPVMDGESKPVPRCRRPNELPGLLAAFSFSQHLFPKFKQLQVNLTPPFVRSA